MEHVDATAKATPHVTLDAALESAGLSPVAETTRQVAYDALPPERRAWLKMTLALVEAVHGQHGETRNGRVRPDLGFALDTHAVPADWTLCLVSAEFAAAPRLAAAIMTARLAGQTNIVAVWDAQPVSALLPVLDLTGVDGAYVAAKPNWTPLIAALNTEFGTDGRMLCFGCRALPKYPCWRDQPPVLAVTDTTDRELLQWAHPDAGWWDGNAAAPPTVRYSDAPGRAALHLKPGLEGAWLCPDLEPDFFMSRSRTLELIRQSAQPV